MSIQALAWVLEREDTTTGADRLVLMSLANHAGWHHGRWECWPTVEQIMREAGVHRRQTVKNAMQRLVESGLIERQINAAPDVRIPARRRPNLYVLNMPAVGARETCPDDDVGARETSSWGHAKRAGGGTESVPQTVSKPSIQPSSDLHLPGQLHLDDCDHERFPFDAFWLLYPRRTAKGAARTAFEKALQRVSLDTVLAAAAKFRDDPNRVDEFTPHPATWLNQSRWGDDPLPARSKIAAGDLTRATKGMSNAEMAARLGIEYRPEWDEGAHGITANGSSDAGSTQRALPSRAKPRGD